MKKGLLLILLSFMFICTFGQVSAEDYFYSGKNKASSGDFKSAIADYTKAIEIDPTQSPVYYNRANSKYHLKDYRGAISDYSMCIEINNKDSEAYFFRGNSKLFLNDTNGACSDWSKAGELGYGDAYDFIQKFCNK